MAVSVKLDEDLKARIQKLAAVQRRSAHWLMREAIQQYVSREEARADFLREASASWEQFQATGLHLTGEEIRHWLRQWDGDAEPDLPKFHK